MCRRCRSGRRLVNISLAPAELRWLKIGERSTNSNLALWPFVHVHATLGKIHRLEHGLRLDDQDRNVIDRSRMVAFDICGTNGVVVFRRGVAHDATRPRFEALGLSLREADTRRVAEGWLSRHWMRHKRSTAAMRSWSCRFLLACIA